MDDRQMQINNICLYYNYMSQYEEDFQKFHKTNSLISGNRKELNNKIYYYLIFGFNLFLLFLGFFLLMLNLIKKYDIVSYTNFDEMIRSKLMLFKYFDILLIAIGGANSIVFYNKNKKYKKELSKKVITLEKEKKELIEILKQAYLGYKNPPLAFEYSSPSVINIILNLLNENPKLTLNEAIKECEISYCKKCD